MARGSQAADRAARWAALQSHDLIGLATLGPHPSLPETPSYTEGETLKAKGEGFQEDHPGWFQKEGLLFLPGNLQGKLVNSLHATTHLGEKALQTLLERTFRGTGIQMTIRQVVPSCPTCQLNNPEGAPRPQPIQQHGTYPGEDWQMDFTQMPVSQGYKYLLVMIDTFTGWIEGFPTRTEKAEKLVKKIKNKNCSMKSSRDFPCPGHYKVKMGHHLLLRSPKGSLKHWALLIISTVPGGLSLQEK